MAQLDGYGEKTKFINSLLNDDFKSYLDIHVEAQSIHDIFTLPLVRKTLSNMRKTSSIDSKKISKIWHYRRFNNLSSSIVIEQRTVVKKANNKPTGKSLRIIVQEYLKTMIGESITAKDVIIGINLIGNNSGVYDILRLFAMLKYIKVQSTSPLNYKVLPAITSVNVRPENKTKSNNKINKANKPKPKPNKKIDKPKPTNNQVELIKVINPQIESIATAELPNFNNLSMGDTINSIIKLQQQMGVYKQALDHIASILAQAGIIEE